MAVLLLLLLISAFFGGSGATWCVCRSEQSTAALQRTLDYACGAGADCGPILQNGACYEPSTVLAHCSYAANSYFQRQNQASGSCDFSGTATIVTADPSYTGCSFPSNASTAGTSTPPASITPGPASPGTPSGTLTPTNTGVLGLGPTSTTGITNTDGNGAMLVEAPVVSLFLAVTFSGLVLLRGLR